MASSSPDDAALLVLRHLAALEQNTDGQVVVLCETKAGKRLLGVWSVWGAVLGPARGDREHAAGTEHQHRLVGLREVGFIVLGSPAPRACAPNQPRMMHLWHTASSMWQLQNNISGRKKQHFLRRRGRSPGRIAGRGRSLDNGEA